MDFTMLKIICFSIGFWILAFVVDEALKNRRRGSSGQEGNTARTSEVSFGKRKLQIITTVVVEA